MTGRLLRVSSSRCCVTLLAIAVGSLGCTRRELSGDDMETEPADHPPELLERHEQACEDWCSIVDECGLDEGYCNCTDRDFFDEHVLCLEKSVLRLECKAALTCEDAERLDSSQPQDEPCFGEGIAESLAC